MLLKIKNIILIMIVLLIIFMPISNASSWGDIISTGNSFIRDGSSETNMIEQDELDSAINEIYNLLLALGIVISVLVGAILGIKFMVGSVEEQAKIKETLIPYIIGCIVVFGAFGIWRILIVVLGKI